MRNYHVVPVTVQNEDWMFNANYTPAVNHHDKNAMEWLMQAHLDHTRAQLEHDEKSSQDTVQREIALVMLLHANLLNAKNLAAVLDLMEQRGYTFVSLESALTDPAYRTADNYVGSDGMSWFDRWQLAFCRPMHPTEPDPPKWVQRQYDEITARKRP